MSSQNFPLAVSAELSVFGTAQTESGAGRARGEMNPAAASTGSILVPPQFHPSDFFLPKYEVADM